MGAYIKNLTTLLNKENGFVFRDIDMELIENRGGSGFNSLINNNAIKNGIQNIFMFRPGQRASNPEFGNRIYKYLHENVDQPTAELIGREIEFMFKYEPRVTVTEINVIPYPDESQYAIKILYKIPIIDNTVNAFEDVLTV